jgi:catechol 2,3-dioxygenase-like lactoylglutathione lyase family enzyme
MTTDWGLRHLYHTIVNCKNIAESVRFYELLGFEILSDRRDAVWPKGSGVSFGLGDTQGRGVLMILPRDPNGPMIDLIEWREPTAEFPEPSPARVPRVIAFRTHNVTAAHRALARQGVKFTTPEPTSIPSAGIIACACCYDPNGNIIELIELEPGLRHSRIKEVFTPASRA